MTLQRNIVTGHLLRVPSGHLAKECCCDVGSAPCDCSPPLDFTYTITLDGFGEASDTRYACIDGAWDVDWTEQCAWSGRHSCVTGSITRYFRLRLEWGPAGEWTVDIAMTNADWVDLGPSITWHLDDLTDPCTDRPPGTYHWKSSSYGWAGDVDEEGNTTCEVV